MRHSSVKCVLLPIAEIMIAIADTNSRITVSHFAKVRFLVY